MALSATRQESSGLREFINSPRGKLATLICAALIILLAGYFIWRSVGPTDAELAARDRWFVDSKTMKPFAHELKAGDMVPVEAPSGDKTGYPAELCYWTKDGQAKKDPTPVLLNQYLGKSAPTFCPDCGRLVVGHNPVPMPGSKPPPTEAEYKPRNAPSRDGR